MHPFSLDDLHDMTDPTLAHGYGSWVAGYGTPIIQMCLAILREDQPEAILVDHKLQAIFWMVSDQRRFYILESHGVEHGDTEGWLHTLRFVTERYEAGLIRLGQCMLGPSWQRTKLTDIYEGGKRK